MVWLPRNKKQTYRLKARPQMGSSGLTLAMTLTLNFQGKIRNLFYLRKKWSDCHKMKSKHISWNLDLKWDHQVWLWPWPWPWIFKVKDGICCISAKNGLIAMKRKQAYRLNPRPQMWSWPWKVRYEDVTDSDQGDFWCWRTVDSSSFLYFNILCFSTVATDALVLKHQDISIPSMD